MIPETSFAIAIHDAPSGEFQLYILKAKDELGALREGLDKLPKDNWSEGERESLTHALAPTDLSEVKEHLSTMEIEYRIENLGHS